MADKPVLAPADILTPKELCARLKVKPGWVYEQMRKPAAKRPPHIRVGKYIRFSWPDVCAWLQGGKAAARG